MVSFEFLNVQSFVIGLACRPHCKQDLAPFLSQTPENRFVDVILAATIPIVSPGPFGVGQAGETPVPERTSQWLDTSSPYTNRFPFTASLSDRTTARQIGKSLG